MNGVFFIRRLKGLHHVSSSLSGPVDLLFRAVSERPKFTVWRQKFTNDSLFFLCRNAGGMPGLGNIAMARGDTQIHGPW